MLEQNPSDTILSFFCVKSFDINSLRLLYVINLKKLGDGDKRTVLKLKRRVAPVKASVLPLVKNNPDIMDKAQEIHRIIRKR
jgi:glycyl-tRNA synthetase (class II)